jgi:hypothetical protein
MSSRLKQFTITKNKLWRLCLQNLSNGCSAHTGTILKWDGSRFYRRNQGKKSARPTLYTRASNEHFLELAAENIHRTCRLIDDIEKSAPKRRIAARQMAALIRLRQRVRNVGRKSSRGIFPFLIRFLLLPHAAIVASAKFLLCQAFTEIGRVRGRLRLKSENDNWTSRKRLRANPVLTQVLDRRNFRGYSRMYKLPERVRGKCCQCLKSAVGFCHTLLLFRAYADCMTASID